MSLEGKSAFFQNANLHCANLYSASSIKKENNLKKGNNAMNKNNRRSEMSTIVASNVNNNLERKGFNATTLVNLTGFTIVIEGKTIRPKMGPVVHTASGGIARYPLNFGSLALNRVKPDGRKEFVRNERGFIQLNEALAPKKEGVLYICSELTRKLFIGREDHILFVPDEQIDLRGHISTSVSGVLTVPMTVYAPVEVNLLSEEELPMEEDEALGDEESAEEADFTSPGMGNLGSALEEALEKQPLEEEVKTKKKTSKAKKTSKKDAEVE